MRHLPSFTIAFVTLAACTSQPQQKEPTPEEIDNGLVILGEMPAAFQGQWDFAEEDCAAAASEMRLVIEASRVSFYESSAVLLTIRQTSEQVLSVTHSFSGEGQQWEEMLGYQLSADGERLTVTSADGSFSTRIQCPS